MTTQTFSPVDLNRDGQVTQKEVQRWQRMPLEQRVAQPDFERMAANWGYAAGFIQATPELAQLLSDIMAEGTTDARVIEARIANSPWGLSYAKTYVEADRIRKGAPDVWASMLDEARTDVMERARNMGADITDEQAIDFAEKFLLTTSGKRTEPGYQEYDEKWLNKVLAGAIDFTKTKTIGGVQVYDLAGTAETQAESLYNIAYEYGMDTSMSNEAFTGWFQNAVKRIVSGETTLEDADDEVVNEAISRFPGLAQQLQRGLTLRQAADPYLKVIGETLEYSPGTLGFDDDLVQRVLNNVDPSGNFVPMSLYDAKLAARRDPRWQYTEKAKNEYTDIASTILKDFGLLG